MSRWDDDEGMTRASRRAHAARHHSRSDGRSDGPDGRRRRQGRRGRPPQRHPLLRGALWTAATVIVALIVGSIAAILSLNANVNRVDVSKMLGTDRPTPKNDRAARAVNILVLGSDTRQGLTTDEYGTDTIEGGAHADTSLLIHVSADRKSVLAVSIPRDSMVPAPKDCDARSTKDQWVVRQWNVNYNKGGTGCTIRTLEGNTGIFVDHYAVVNFEGFRDMVDALGGVEVCTPIAIDDKASGLTLTPGRHVLDGHDALGYVRVRKTITGGSDINRIKRQQAFLSSVAQKAVSTEMLKRPDKLYGFLSAATKALTTDPDFGISEMGDVAKSLQNVGPRNIEFVTVPIEEYPQDTNRVQWAPNAEVLWSAIRDDRRIGESPSPSASAPGSTASPSTTPTRLTVSPASITVKVLNGSGVRGLAAQEAEALRIQGFAAVTTGDAQAPMTGVVVEHAPYQVEAARTVAAAFPGATLKVNPRLGDTIQVTLGIGAPHVVELPNRLGTKPLPTPSITASVPASPSPSGSHTGGWGDINTRTADEDICS